MSSSSTLRPQTRSAKPVMPQDYVIYTCFNETFMVATENMVPFDQISKDIVFTLLSHSKVGSLHHMVQILQGFLICLNEDLNNQRSQKEQLTHTFHSVFHEKILTLEKMQPALDTTEIQTIVYTDLHSTFQKRVFLVISSQSPYSFSTHTTTTCNNNIFHYLTKLVQRVNT